MVSRKKLDLIFVQYRYLNHHQEIKGKWGGYLSNSFLPLQLASQNIRH